MSCDGGVLRSEVLMGTRFFIDVRDPGVAVAAVDAAVERLHWIDQTFSTFRADSEIARLNRGELAEAEASPEVREVLSRCRFWRDQTDGAYDVEAAAQMPEMRRRVGGGGRPGAVEPSGYVKAWALDQTWQRLSLDGVRNVHLQAGTSLLVRGHPRPSYRWRLRVPHPSRTSQAILEVSSLALATSGEHRRGVQIIDPRIGRKPHGLRSVSCVSRDLATAEVLATAAFAMGFEGRGWLAERSDVEALVVSRDDVVSLTPGLAAWVVDRG